MIIPTLLDTVILLCSSVCIVIVMLVQSRILRFATSIQNTVYDAHLLQFHLLTMLS